MKRTQSGFSILEVIVAMTIFSIGIGLCLEFVSSSFKEYAKISKINDLEDLRYFYRRNLSCERTMLSFPGHTCPAAGPVDVLTSTGVVLVPSTGMAMGPFSDNRVRCDGSTGLIPEYWNTKKIPAPGWDNVLPSDSPAIDCRLDFASTTTTNQIFIAFEDDPNYAPSHDSLDRGMCIRGPGLIEVTGRDFISLSDQTVDFTSRKIGSPDCDHRFTIQITNLNGSVDTRTFLASSIVPPAKISMPVLVGSRINVTLKPINSPHCHPDGMNYTIGQYQQCSPKLGCQGHVCNNSKILTTCPAANNLPSTSCDSL